MSFFSGLATGVLTSIDRTLQRELQETRDYNKEINNIRFKAQMEEKDEWDDDVEEARKALQNGAAAFRDPTTGELDPRAMAFAASALKEVVL